MSKKLGIAFGGSGAQGIASIAYIKALEALEIKPDIVSGTGVGAVVAAMYAAGMSSQDMIDFLQEINFPGSKRPININKIKDAKYGILDGLGLEEYYQMVVPVKVFDRLYFPLKIVAANWTTGQQVIFDSGDVGPAVRSAMSIPGVFMPNEVNGEMMMDGSCVNPVPFDIIRDDCDVLVAIEPQVNEEEGPAPNVYSVICGAFNAARKALGVEKQKACKVDHFESVVVEETTAYDFAFYHEIIESAEEKAGLFALKVQDLLK
jgi:NTE family protein